MTVCTINNINNMYPNEVFINNHIDIIVKYHQAPEFTVRFVPCNGCGNVSSDLSPSILPYPFC